MTEPPTSGIAAGDADTRVLVAVHEPLATRAESIAMDRRASARSDIGERMREAGRKQCIVQQRGNEAATRVEAG